MHAHQDLRQLLCRSCPPMGAPSWLRPLVFAVAALFGIFFALVWRSYELAAIGRPYSLTTAPSLSRRVAKSVPALYGPSYSSWLATHGLKSRRVSEELVSFGGESKKRFLFEDEFLKQQVPVLCLVLSKGRGKARAVKETWGRRCNRVLFFANYVDKSIPVQRYSSMEPSHVSFCKILVTISASMNLSDFKWLLISEDSAFVVVENVRKLVAPLNHNQAYYLGRPVKRFGLPPYNALDSGILLSQAALLYLTRQYFLNLSDCQNPHIILSRARHEWSNSSSHGNESIAVSRNFDASLAQILSAHNHSHPYDTRDQRGRAKFMAISPEKYLIKGAISLFSVFWRQNIFNSHVGLDCCSSEVVSMNGISPSRMFLLDYLLYHTVPFRNSPLRTGNDPVSSILQKKRITNQLYR